MKDIVNVLKNFLRGIGKGIKERSISIIKNEIYEYENVFALIIISLFSGIPSPPAGIFLRLLPYMQKELDIMIKESLILDDIFVQTISHFDID